ncbi:MAG: PaaI family thioesterase [Actinobacteria bacterium]|nr:PaaI family thioesterase [Actinomycetota bacterium]
MTLPEKYDYPKAESFATAERLRLAAAARDLVDTVLVAHEVDGTTLDAAASAIARVVDDLRAAERDRGGEPSDIAADTGHNDYLPRSPVVGVASPIAPPLSWETLDGAVHAHGIFPTACEGPPGFVHGGWIALAFDEVLGIANIAAGHPGMTGRLTVRYRRPTPLRREVHFDAAIARVEGRRIVTKASLVVDGELTAECEGIFVQPTPERRREYFGDRLGAAEGRTAESR